jgi:hypothetical protein
MPPRLTTRAHPHPILAFPPAIPPRLATPIPVGPAAGSPSSAFRPPPPDLAGFPWNPPLRHHIKRESGRKRKWRHPGKHIVHPTDEVEITVRNPTTHSSQDQRTSRERGHKAPDWHGPCCKCRGEHDARSICDQPAKRADGAMVGIGRRTAYACGFRFG